MGLLDDCEKLFGTKNLYEVLNLSKDSTKLKPAEIIGSPSLVKKAYYRMSLQHHPDRADEQEDKAESTRRFQALCRVYTILSDAEKRAIFDETGVVDDGDALSENKDWTAAWRQVFRKVTPEDLINFETNYKGSAEEKQDLMAFYERFQGDLSKIMECMPCCRVLDDEARYTDLLKELIDAGEVPAFDKFTKEKASKKEARRKRAAKEAKEAEKMLQELTGSKDASFSDLTKAIQLRQQGRSADFDGFCDELAAKYAKKDGGTSQRSGRKKKTQ